MAGNKSEGNVVKPVQPLNILFVFTKGCNKLTTIPAFSTSYVTDAGSMFEGCSRLNITVGNFTLTRVTNALRMFYNCSSLSASVNLNLSAATNCDYLFYGCSSIQTISYLTIPNCNNATGMFTGCNLLKLLRFYGAKTPKTVDVKNTSLDSYGLNELITSLIKRTDGASLLISNTPAATTLTSAQRTNASNKGYTITA